MELTGNIRRIVNSTVVTRILVEAVLYTSFSGYWLLNRKYEVSIP
jgi:hypothetical protein